MKKNLDNLPESTAFITGSTELVERYEQETAYILAALGEINEDFKYALITDETVFSDFDLTPEELISVGDLLQIDLSNEDKLVVRARELQGEVDTISKLNYSLDS